MRNGGQVTRHEDIESCAANGSGLATLALAISPPPGLAHEGHWAFAAGEPGDAKKPARTVRVAMREEDSDKRMLFEPSLGLKAVSLVTTVMDLTDLGLQS